MTHGLRAARRRQHRDMKSDLPPDFLRLASAAALLCATALATAAPQIYSLDPEHSFVHFEVLHFGTSTIRGRIGPVTGKVVLDSAAGRGELSLRINTATVDTGLRFFDARVREPDLLASAAFPEAYFVATRFRFDGVRLAEVRGEFTWRGVSQPLSLKALRFGCRSLAASGTAAAAATATASAGEVCGGDFEAEFKRSDFGATFGLPFVADRVRLQVQVEGLRQPGR